MGAHQADVQRTKSLLPVEYAVNLLMGKCPGLSPVVRPALVVFLEKFVENVVIRLFPTQLPEEEGADWVIPHQRIEQKLDLMLAPNELPLQRGQVQLIVINVLDRLLNGLALVAHTRQLSLARYRASQQ